MQSIDIANAFIARHGYEIEITNLKLNKLVYYAHVESIRQGNGPLFDDAVEAWQYGPVEPSVYHTFKTSGRQRIEQPSSKPKKSDSVKKIISLVAETYGKLSAFDLVTFSHREGGAWSRVYSPGADNPITVADIMASDDMDGFPGVSGTIVNALDDVAKSIPNTLRLLENS